MAAQRHPLQAGRDVGRWCAPLRDHDGFGVAVNGLPGYRLFGGCEEVREVEMAAEGAFRELEGVEDVPELERPVQQRRARETPQAALIDEGQLGEHAEPF